jgi:alkyl hydroperoxide reductase subunit AhpC
MSKLVLTHLNHDLKSQKSFVVLAWPDDPTRHLGLEVPFGTVLPDAQQEAARALDALIQELGEAEIVLAPG